MISPWLVAFLSILGVANLLLLMIIAYSGTKSPDKNAKICLVYIAIVLVLNMFVLFGGVSLW